MRKTLLTLSIAVVLGGCSSMPMSVYTGQRDCGYIGCESGGLTVIPHEEYSASTQARRWYGWEWGKTSSAMKRGSPEWREAKKNECAKLASYGLDCMGRPLYNQN